MRNKEKIPLYDEENDYVDEDDIDAFASALMGPDDRKNLTGSISSRSFLARTKANVEASQEAQLINAANANLNSDSLKVQRPDLITSSSDWYPINLQLHFSHSPSENEKKGQKKKSKRKQNVTTSNEFTYSTTYRLLRWPLLLLILGWIILLCMLYLLVRLYVALMESYLTWVGKRKTLRDKLRASRSYEEWKQNAIELDKYLGLEKWSHSPNFSYYDYKTVQLTIDRLKQLRSEGLDAELMVFLEGCLKKNFAGIENKQLYSHRYFGTKDVVNQYVDEVTKCIDIVRESGKIPFDAKRRFFKIVLRNYGKTALCLSGGACFSYTHFGIVKALLDNEALPKIISGTSGGGLVAALACTRTDEELRKLLVPQLARKITACEDPWYVWFPRWWKTGARFDSLEWARKSNFFTKGSTTFAEAYKKTGRILNISTVPADEHSPVILCNNITSPNCIIWSSLLASAAVPGILNPVVLLMRDPESKKILPFSMGSKFRDGSLRTDIPLNSLSKYYNVNFSVVSQVNPHILLFFFAPKGTVGRPVTTTRRKTNKGKYATLRGGFIATALEQLFRLEITKWLHIIRSLDLLPHFLEQNWLNIWLQKFSGTITIWPRNRLKDFWYILSDPNEERLEEMLIKGERCVYPKILFIKHRLSIERAIERGRRFTKAKHTPGSEPWSGNMGKEILVAHDPNLKNSLFNDSNGPEAFYDSDSSNFSEKKFSKDNENNSIKRPFQKHGKAPYNSNGYVESDPESSSDQDNYC